MQIIDVITEYIHNAYEYQVDKLSYIGYRCICIDLRGYGKSDRPAYWYDYNTMAKDIRHIIEALKIDNIKITTLILHGTHDKVCPYPFAEYMNNAIDNSVLVPLTESGHGAFAEEIDKVNSSIISFINQQ